MVATADISKETWMKGRGRGPSFHKDQMGAHCGGVFKELGKACPTAGSRMIFHTLSSTSANEGLEKTYKAYICSTVFIQKINYNC